ncbi:MAG: hypothetical protein JSS87_01800 [Acidobacteria bacterium]|nr:hypothetical protein [Acidobacteriota bacterium]
MKRVWKRWQPGWLIGVLLGWALGGMGGVAHAEVLRTHVADTLYTADGGAAHGTALISWPSFTTAAGETVAKGSMAVTLGETGGLSVSLAPNAGASPVNTYYTVVFHLGDGAVSREFWVVPVSESDVRLEQVRVSVLPASVAMQTVSRQYVDQAIARAVAELSNDDSTAYVRKAGDTMAGPLVLPGDPVLGTQASTKSYVDASVAQTISGLGSMSMQNADAVHVTGGVLSGLTSAGMDRLDLTIGTTSAHGLNFGDANLYRSAEGQTVFNANASGEIGVTVSNLNNGPGADSFFRVQSNNAITTSFGFYAFGPGRGAGGLIKPLSGYLSTANGMTNGMVIATESAAPVVFGYNNAESVRVQQGLSVGTSADPGAGNVLAAGAVIGSVQAIAYSATPVLSVHGNANRIVLTGDVVSSTMDAGADGQRMCIAVVQDATGGHAFAWPVNMLGAMTVGTAAGKRSQQCFVYYAADGAWIAESAGVVNE